MAFAELLRPEQTADGFESEERLVICGVSWGGDTWPSTKRSAKSAANSEEWLNRRRT